MGNTELPARVFSLVSWVGRVPVAEHCRGRGRSTGQGRWQVPGLHRTQWFGMEQVKLGPGLTVEVVVS